MSVYGTGIAIARAKAALLLLRREHTTNAGIHTDRFPPKRSGRHKRITSANAR